MPNKWYQDENTRRGYWAGNIKDVLDELMLEQCRLWGVDTELSHMKPIGRQSGHTIKVVQDFIPVAG